MKLSSVSCFGRGGGREEVGSPNLYMCSSALASGEPGNRPFWPKSCIHIYLRFVRLLFRTFSQNRDDLQRLRYKFTKPGMIPPNIQRNIEIQMTQTQLVQYFS